MQISEIIIATILGTIGFVFTIDCIFYIFKKNTISEQITGWINKSRTNLIIFLSIVAVICTHFIFSKY